MPCDGVFFVPPVTMKNVHVYYKLEEFYSSYKSFVMPKGHYDLFSGESIDNEELECGSIS